MGLWRLFLAWMVVAVHTRGYDELFSIDIGVIAVTTFFFISGFLMPLAYRASYESDSFWDGCKRFFLNRVLRIYPLYWLSLLPFVVVAIVRFARGEPATHGFMTYVQNLLLLGLNQSQFWHGYHRFNNPAWTLDVELQYYLLVPFLILVGKWRQTALFPALALLAAGSLALYFFPTQSVDIDRSLLAWSVFFIAGFALHESKQLQSFIGRPIAGVAMAVLLALLAILPDLSKASSLLLVIFAFVAISAPLLAMQKTRQFGARDRLAGDLSYPVYILHILLLTPTLRLLDGLGVGGLPDSRRFAATLVVNILVATGVGYLAFRLVGRPLEWIRSTVRSNRDVVAAEQFVVNGPAI